MMQLNRDIHIIQIYDNSYEYGKNEKSYSERKHKHQWKEFIYSKSAIIKNKKLIINKEKINFLDISNTNVIIIVDYNVNNEYEILEKFNFMNILDYAEYFDKNDLEKMQILNKHLKKIQYIFQGDFIIKPFEWECLSLKKNENINVYLNWNNWDMNLIPKRDNFKISKLGINKPIEIKINGKKDYKERIFIEKDCIVEYLGKINEYELVDNSKAYFKKIIPKNRKVINLVKVLY